MHIIQLHGQNADSACTRSADEHTRMKIGKHAQEENLMMHKHTGTVQTCVGTAHEEENLRTCSHKCTSTDKQVRRTCVRAEARRRTLLQEAQARKVDWFTRILKLMEASHTTASDGE